MSATAPKLVGNSNPLGSLAGHPAGRGVFFAAGAVFFAAGAAFFAAVAMAALLSCKVNE
jgi:hypothetical protein